MKKKNIIFHLEKEVTNRKAAHIGTQQPAAEKNLSNQVKPVLSVLAEVTGSYIRRLKGGQTLQTHKEPL